MSKNLQPLPIISQNTLKAHNNIEEIILVDVRESEERIANKIELSPQCHLPLAEIKYFELGKLTNLDKNQQIVCYCNSGRRSLIATMFLRTAGFTNVSSLAQGIQAWKK